MEYIKPSALIYYMVYSMVESPFLHCANVQDLLANDELGMFTTQGVEAFARKVFAYWVKACRKHDRQTEN